MPGPRGTLRRFIHSLVLFKSVQRYCQPKKCIFVFSILSQQRGESGLGLMPLSIPQICMGFLPQLFLIVLHNLTLSLHHIEAIGPWASTCLELSVVDLAVAERRLVSNTPA
jgi:hypothetical protein